MVDWTEVLVAFVTYAVPPIVSALGGAFVMWLRLHKDAQLGRSLRPGPGPKPKRTRTMDYPPLEIPTDVPPDPPTRSHKRPPDS